MKKIDIPFWIYFVVAGIILSAYMVIRTGREERMIEEEIIEKEGEIYMQRLEREREEKKNTQNSAG
ncbi:sporulation YhaL family protein [Niallia oryzisoli]|uniref:Sporulation YhaL family protein n=1 Tax=Niallia oryzisoli TaxID=1737571 RepID=A0ABZ2CFD4_9BACI